MRSVCSQLAVHCHKTQPCIAYEAHTTKYCLAARLAVGTSQVSKCAESVNRYCQPRSEAYYQLLTVDPVVQCDRITAIMNANEFQLLSNERERF